MAWSGYSYFRTVSAAENPGVRMGQVPDEFRCDCTAKGTGKRCRNFRVRGTKRCRTHGGTRPGMKMSRAKQLRLAARARGERPKHYLCD